MMTIRMYCDKCGVEIPSSESGGARLRTGKQELSFHLCPEHAAELRQAVRRFCEAGEPREVQPSLKR